MSASSTVSDFSKDWVFPSVVMADIEGAVSYITRDSEHKFKTGRPKIEVSFLDCDQAVIETRFGMRLISKKGKPYDLCSTKDPTMGCTGKLDLGDAFGCSVESKCTTA
jgi:hypothetical protein